MFTGLSLADGTLTSSGVTVYTVTTDRAIIKTFVVFNTGSTDETVKVYLNRGTSNRQVGIAVLKQNQSAQFFEGEAITLSTGDTLIGVTTSSVDYFVTGATEGA